MLIAYKRRINNVVCCKNKQIIIVAFAPRRRTGLCATSPHYALMPAFNLLWYSSLRSGLFASIPNAIIEAFFNAGKK